VFAIVRFHGLRFDDAALDHIPDRIADRVSVFGIVAEAAFSMITHTMPLGDINKAFALMREGKSIRSVVIF